MINRGGETLSPAEIEDAVLQLEGIAKAMVFAIADKQLGENIGLKAFKLFPPRCLATSAKSISFTSVTNVFGTRMVDIFCR